MDINIKELKNSLNDIQIKTILQSLGGVIWDENSENIILNTICHGGNSMNKLYYNKKDKTFYCYTHCGLLDIITIVSEVRSCGISDSINYICTLLKISKYKEGFFDETLPLIKDWSFINNHKLKYENLRKPKKNIEIISKNTLNIFQKIYTYEWINDNISKEVMIHYNILYSTLRQSIIVPHYDIDDNLIGIRQRALLEFDILNYGKYTPFSVCGYMYNHALGQNLYGINFNKDCIKRLKKVMLVESEKGVLQSATYFGIDNNFTLALCGCARITRTQIELLQSLGVEEVIIGLDRQYEEKLSKEYEDWVKHLQYKIINPLMPYFKINVLWDNENLLGYKQSPTDKGKDILLKMMKSKLYVKG